MNESHPINGIDLIVVILHEIERQQPGAMISQYQFDVMTQACNAIASAMGNRPGTVLIETGTPHES